jgi:hypothetical protein
LFFLLLRPRFWIPALSLVVACGLAVGVFWFRARAAVYPADLVAYLPTANASVVYIDVDALRRSGMLDMLAGSKTAEEPDYRQFVLETKFDYRQDLDAVAAALKDGRIYFALRGHFHWSNLKDYAERQNGSCHNGFCVVQGSQPNRRISFYPLKRDVLAMAIGPDDFGAYQVANQPAKPALAEPKDPFWAIIPGALFQRDASLQSMDALPAAAKAYMPALQGADQIVFSIGAPQDRQLQLGLHVTCKDAAAASALLTQFQTITKALQDLLAHQRQKPDPADFGGVLVAGTFRRDERHVYGAWPIPKAFVDAIAGSVP